MQESEAGVTEIGRRTAMLVGTGALAISVLVGLCYGGDLVIVCINGLAAGLFFGLGGLLIGNLIESYVFRAARRELERQALMRELQRELKESGQKDKAAGTKEATGEAGA